MKLNKEQYEQVYEMAGTLEGLAHKVDTAVDQVIEVVAAASGWLERTAEVLRTEADKNVAGNVWGDAADDVKVSEYKVDIKGKTPDEVVQTLRDLINEHYNKYANEGKNIGNVDDLLRHIFKDSPGTDEDTTT